MVIVLAGSTSESKPIQIMYLLLIFTKKIKKPSYYSRLKGVIKNLINMIQDRIFITYLKGSMFIANIATP